jgi:F-type H+-transporting ATPase subunit b
MDMEINPLTVLATIINFGIFYFIMSKILFKPVTKAISSREDEIKGRIKRAEEIEQQSEVIKLQNEERLNNAREEGKIIVEDLKHKAEKTAEDIIIKAKAEAEFILERAKMDAEREREKAEDEIKLQAINLALLLSSKALENTIDESEHRRLIKDFIAKVG